MSNLPVKRQPYLIATSDLWRWNGTIHRLPYLVLGTVLFATKYAIDFTVAHSLFHRAWPIWAYFFPGQAIDVLATSADERRFFVIILVLALPFIWTGVVLSMRRLRDVGIPVYWVKLFFLPFVNLVFFFLLCTLPGQLEDSLILNQEQRGLLEKDMQPEPIGAGSSKLFPAKQKAPVLVRSENSDFWDVSFSLLCTVPPAVVISWFGMFALQQYGWGLFVGIPFAVGMSSAYLFGRNTIRTVQGCLGIASLATLLLGFGFFAMAWEGAGCLMMASPIALVLALMGAMLGYNMQRNKYKQIQQTMSVLALLVVMPLLMGAEFAIKQAPPLVAVVSTIETTASPETVWHNVIAFPQLPPPTEAMFKIGIAYPIGATINGTGVGALRNCRFSTGSFVEPIKVWDEPRLLKFGVIAQPASMREFSWMHEIQPAHLHGYLIVKAGQFQLTPIRMGEHTGTRLVGTTWYENRMWPSSYWRLWSSNIIHTIHMRVLRHIKSQSESHSP